MKIATFFFVVLSFACASVFSQGGGAAPVLHPAAYANERQWKNVMDHGAKGDGVTDDLAAIQAAIDAVVDSGGTVFVPHSASGFLITNTIRIPSYVRLKGIGIGSVIRMHADTSRAIIANSDTVNGDTGIVIEDIFFDGNKSYTLFSDRDSADCISLINVHRSTVRNCWVTRTDADGIAIRNSTDCAVQGNVIWETGEDGITVAGLTSLRNIVSGNHVTGRDTSYEVGGLIPSGILCKSSELVVSGNIVSEGGAAIDINNESGDTLRDITVTGNLFLNCWQTTVSIADGVRLVVSGNSFYECATEGVYTWSVTPVSHDVNISNNTFYSQGGIAIRAVSGDNYVISGNVIVASEVTAMVVSGDHVTVTGNRIDTVLNGHGIHLQSTRYSSVSGNVVSEVAGRGIYSEGGASGGEYMAITGNTVRLCDGPGIYLSASDFVTISGNICADNDSAGIWLNGSYNNEVIGNVCTSPTDVQEYGVALSGSSKNYISNNQLGGNASDTAVLSPANNHVYANRDDTLAVNTFIDFLGRINLRNIANTARIKITGLDANVQLNATSGEPHFEFLFDSTSAWKIRADGTNKTFAIRRAGADRLAIDSATHAVRFNEAFTFPTSDGAAGEVLETNGSGTITWQPNDTGVGAGGEANTLVDTGTFDGASGFGLAQTKVGTELRIRGLIEGSNITITTSGDTGLSIASTGGAGIWSIAGDTNFLIDAENDTLARFWDDDAGAVTWEVATGYSLKIIGDTGFFGTIDLLPGDTTPLNVGTDSSGRFNGGNIDAHFGNSVAGIVEIGKLHIGMHSDTTYNSGLLDVDQCVQFGNKGTPTGNFEFLWYESNNNIRFGIPKSANGLGTYNARSMIIAGPSVLNDSICRGTYWGFDHLSMITSTQGADLAVQNNTQILDTLFIGSGTGSSVDTITPTTLDGYMEDGDINTFAELQAWVTDKTLLNDADAATIAALWVFTQMLRVDNDLQVEGNIYINKDSTLADAILYFQDDDEIVSFHWDDANNQFELSDGLDIITGNLDVSSGNITVSGTVDGVNVSAHASRHEDTGGDEVAVTAGMMNTGTGATASTFWRGDNTWATPVGVGGLWDTVGTRDTVVLVGSSDTLMTVADTGTSTSIETQNAEGFLFLDPIAVGSLVVNYYTNLIFGVDIDLNDTDNVTIDARTNPRTVTKGAFRLNHTPEASTQNTRAILLDVDANSVPGTQGLHINYKATALEAGEVGIGIDVEGVTSTSTGGVIRGVEVSRTGVGSAEVHALHASAGVNPIHQEAGSFATPTQVWGRDTSLTAWANLTSPDAVGSAVIDSTLFAEVDDYLYVGNTATFNEVDFVFNTFAGGSGISPTFQFSIAGPGWTTFTPIDNTDGCRSDGGIEWEVADLTSWASVTVNGVASFYVRILRNQGGGATDPIESRVQTSATDEYKWDSTGALTVKNVFADSADIDTVTANKLKTNLLIVGSDSVNVFGYGFVNSDDSLKVDTAAAVADAEPLPVTGNAVYDWGVGSPVITTPTLTLKQSTTPTPDDEGVIEWDTDNDRIIVGQGGAQNATFYSGAHTAAGLWVEQDTMFLVDSEGDTVAAWWDDDAGNVRWQVATEDQTLHILVDTLTYRGVLLTPTGTELNYVDGVTSAIQTQLDNMLLKSTFDAQTILHATSDNTPVALTVTEQTLVGRLTGGNITAVALGIADNNVVQVDHASPADDDYAKFTANGLEGRSYAEVVSDIGALTGNESITLSGDASGSGATAIAVQIEGGDSLQADTIVATNVLKAVDSFIVGADGFTDLTGPTLDDSSGNLIVKDAGITSVKVGNITSVLDTAHVEYSDTAGVALSTADRDAAFLGYTVFKGNVSYWGEINQLDYMDARAEHATAFLKLPNAGDYTAGDTAICVQCDSSDQLHPAFVYAGEGLYASSNDTMTNGYRRHNRRALGVGPICTNDDQENPHFLVRDEKYGWHEFFVGIESTYNCSGDDSIPVGFGDSTAVNPIYGAGDSLFFRGDAWNVGDSSWIVNVGGAGFLSDQALFLDFSDTLYMPFRGTWTTPTPDTHMIALGYTSNGYQWSEGVVILSKGLCYNRGDSAPDRSLGAVDWDFMSPTIIPDTGGTYEMWTVEHTTDGTDTTYIVKWEAPKVDSGWRWVRGPGSLGRCIYTPAIAGSEPWHMRVKRRGQDELWALVAEQPTGVGGSGGDAYLTIAVSYDDGFTWQSSDTILAKGSDAWNDNRVYASDGAWVNEGNRRYFELYYSANGTAHGWATAQTELRFPIPVNDVDWTWEHIPFTTVHGRGPGVTDSVELHLPRWDAGMVLAHDSTNQGSDRDSFWISGTVPFAADTCDSIIFVYKGDGGANIDSLWLFGPDRSDGVNRADSEWAESNVDLTASSWTRYAWFVGEGSINAGENFAVKFNIDMTTDEDWIQIAWLHMRVRR